jgi:purine nucleoside phosphorylase
LNTAAKFIKEKLGTAEIAVVMGSGLNDFYELLENKKVLDYVDIPGSFHFFLTYQKECLYQQFLVTKVGLLLLKNR